MQIVTAEDIRYSMRTYAKSERCDNECHASARDKAGVMRVCGSRAVMVVQAKNACMLRTQPT